MASVALPVSRRSFRARHRFPPGAGRSAGSHAGGPSRSGRLPPGCRLPGPPAEVATGPALLSRTVLYYWPGDGWVRWTVARRNRTLEFWHWHLVRYSPPSRSARTLGAAMVDSLLVRAGRLLGPVMPDALAGSLLSARDNRDGPYGPGPAGIAGLTRTQRHYKGVCLSDYLACA